MTVKYWEGKSLEDDTGCKDPDCLCKTDDEKEAPGEYISSGFGLAFLKPEGGHIHPDDPMMHDLSDAEYTKQAQGYINDCNLSRAQTFKTYWSRPNLLKEIWPTA